MRSWWRRSWWWRRRYNLTWKRVDKDINRVMTLLTSLDDNGHCFGNGLDGEPLREQEREMWQILVNLEMALSDSWLEGAT